MLVPDARGVVAAPGQSTFSALDTALRERCCERGVNLLLVDVVHQALLVMGLRAPETKKPPLQRIWNEGSLGTAASTATSALRLRPRLLGCAPGLDEQNRDLQHNL